LDTMVTVVDGYNFLKDYGSQDMLGDRGLSLGEEDERTVVDLLVEQIEFCDVLVLNKTDLLTLEEVSRLESILKTLNPRAQIIHSSFGKVPLNRIMHTGLFDFDQAAEAPGWLQELRGEHVPESEEYGISSFVYRARKPFHPQRLWQWLNTEWPGVVRSKGRYWIASRPEFCATWSQAGAVTRTELAGMWWSATPQEYWPQDEESLQHIHSRIQAPYGDRQQELVVIGMGMDKAALTAAFDACLLTEAELASGMDAWRQLSDPFPQWSVNRQDESPERVAEVS
jgi:G3E family GTPase